MLNEKKLKTAVEAYLENIRAIRRSGGATGEMSQYPPLVNLLNTVGDGLKPKVFCVANMADQGSGHPDMGLYAGQQISRKGKPDEGQTPERGVVEVKALGDDAWVTAKSEQVSRYWERYHLVLVTNYRDFVLVGQNNAGHSEKMETFRLAASEEEFVKRLEDAHAFAADVGVQFGEYLGRALSHNANIEEPQELAKLLASYARDALTRAKNIDDSDKSLKPLRDALEESLGVHFEGANGKRFFCSSLVQTLFYGIFSAWVLWAQKNLPAGEKFQWKMAAWELKTPIMSALFQQMSAPGRVSDLVEVLNWAESGIGRVSRAAFFRKFAHGEAVQYFYEPFLAEFDPELRKELGVWYTPPELVEYMVARVDRALREDLKVAEGLAAENVYVLDPCCGTGAYLSEVLRRIDGNLENSGKGALKGARLKQAATNRVFGFEIMPAPFVISHLQVGLTMQKLNAPLNEEDGTPGVFLTNALTGWEPRTTKPLPFPELEDEREKANSVKQNAPILVILGNPPYNGFAGVAADDEQKALSDAYREARDVPPPEGQGLNDLYVRFFRMAERRIADKTGRGVVCFISNYSWLDGLSYNGMRERLADVFDTVRIDNLHGDRIISEYAPDGAVSETVFSIAGQSPGIQVGICVALFSREEGEATRSARLLYRDFHQGGAEERRRAMLKSAKAADIDADYAALEKDPRLGLPFKPMKVSEEWFDWPELPALFPSHFPGVKTGRDPFLVATDKREIGARIGDYFNSEVSDDDMKARFPAAMKDSTSPRREGRAIRHQLLGSALADHDLVRYVYRPFDNRWLYWSNVGGLLDGARPEYKRHIFEGNIWLSAARLLRKGESEPQATFAESIASLHIIERSAEMFPAYLRGDIDGEQGEAPNLSEDATHYIERIGVSVEDLFYFTLAVLHDSSYLQDNAGGLKMGWPRIPLPAWEPTSESSGAKDEILARARQGRRLAELLNPDKPIEGVTEGNLPGDIAVIAVPSKIGGGNMSGDDFNLTAHWGRFGSNQAVMPGQGHADERFHTPEEREKMGITDQAAKTYDIRLNDNAYWRNIPVAAWEYKLGGYRVLKKWLSYRAHSVINRALTPEEVELFTAIARRIAAILAITK